MSDETPAYNQTYITAWTILSIAVTAALFLTYVFGSMLLHAGHWVWDLLRYLATPII